MMIWNNKHRALNGLGVVFFLGLVSRFGGAPVQVCEHSSDVIGTLSWQIVQKVGVFPDIESEEDVSASEVSDFVVADPDVF